MSIHENHEILLLYSQKYIAIKTLKQLTELTD